MYFICQYVLGVCVGVCVVVIVVVVAVVVVFLFSDMVWERGGG